ncbi:MAG: anti-sigma factor [Anaerobacillus sp.]
MTEHVTKLLNSYIDGEVSKEESVIVESHLVACSSCEREYMDLIQTKQLIAEEYKAIAVSTNLEDRIMDTISTNKVKKELRPVRVQVASLVGVILLGLIVMLVHFIPGGWMIGSSLLNFSLTLMHASAISMSALPYVTEVVGGITVILLGILGVVLQKFYFLEKV